MRSFIVAFVVVVGAAIAAPVAAFAEADHYEANHCEYHIEKIQLIPGSYNSISAALYLKVALPHLDGDIKEIGFRARTFIDNHDSNEGDIDWRNISAERVNPFGLADQWKVTVSLEAGGRISVHEGVFYILTTNGTWYWLHPMHDMRQNFIVRTDTFMFNNELVWDELWVNDYPELRGFNPNVCR